MQSNGLEDLSSLLHVVNSPLQFITGLLLLCSPPQACCCSATCLEGTSLVCAARGVIVTILECIPQQDSSAQTRLTLLTEVLARKLQ